MFAPLPDKPDHDALEREILEPLGARADVRAGCASRTPAGPRFSFVDGPVTANRMVLGVHTAWGRTLKDVFQRYKALRGYHQRYQNGFDCQGLWIEVGVERELGLNSKREIEEFGLAEFARRCREVVVQSSRGADRGLDPARPVDGLGQRLLHVQRHEHRVHLAVPAAVHERGWLYLGHRSTEWCPRCGTSLSQHELTQCGVYQERSDPSLYVRFPLLDRAGRVARRLDDDAVDAARERRGRGEARRGVRAARERRVGRGRALSRTRRSCGRVRARSSSGFATAGRSTTSARAPRSSIASSPGTRSRSTRARGIVHIAPGAGQEDFELGRVHDLPVLTPVDEAGRFYDAYGWLHGLSTGGGRRPDRRRPRRAGLPRRGRARTSTATRTAGAATRRSSSASPTTGSSSVDELRQPLLDANATVEWTPAYMGKRMDDWLRNMGDWNISRRRYYGLPLPFYPCACGHAERDRLEGGARASARSAGLERARGAPPPVDRRGADPLRGVRRGGASASPRSATSGSTPGSSRSRRSAGRAPSTSRGLRDRRGAGADARRPARPRLLGGVVPGRLGLGDARADPALVLLAALHVGRADRAGAVPQGARLREDARRDGPRDAQLVGEHDRRPGRVRADGRGRDALAVLRAAARPEPPLRLRAGARDPAEAADALELGDVPRRLRERRVASTPRYDDLDAGPSGELEPLDRWLVERTRQLVARGDRALRALAHGRRDPRLRGVRRRPLELVHPPLAPALLGRRRGGAPRRSGTRSSRRSA